MFFFIKSVHLRSQKVVTPTEAKTMLVLFEISSIGGPHAQTNQPKKKKLVLTLIIPYMIGTNATKRKWSCIYIQTVKSHCLKIVFMRLLDSLRHAFQ